MAIDQALLLSRHVFARLFGLWDKVVIVDEVPANAVYMPLSARHERASAADPTGEDHVAAKGGDPARHRLVWCVNHQIALTLDTDDLHRFVCQAARG